jgi:AmmeMemoRadiSam system protein B
LSYPNHPVDLRDTLNDILAKESPVSKPNGKITALIAPHIDIVVGAKAYAAAYRMLEHTKPSRVIILGTGHKLINRLFSITGKNFETPLGTLKTDQDAVEYLRSRGKEVIAKDDFEHRTEHAIEFQTLFLQHLLQEGSYEIVPILCGPVQASLHEYSRKAFQDRTDSFCQGLVELLAETGRETIIVAGVDFSHIGPKFGHDMPATHLQVPAETHDKKLIHCLAQLDSDGFWEESRAVQDRYNVCGFSAMACLLEVLPPGKGALQHYHLWHEEATRSAVSFAAMTFTTS